TLQQHWWIPQLGLGDFFVLFAGVIFPRAFLELNWGHCLCDLGIWQSFLLGIQARTLRAPSGGSKSLQPGEKKAES
ncbi:hypothetical protein, partial [Synechococcus sp. R60.3]|uniref:hypothetical protein n=1 Tax=Synechococcus sp. R60.3 TaxID=2967123 RepID=UPI0039C43D9F